MPYTVKMRRDEKDGALHMDTSKQELNKNEKNTCCGGVS